MEKKKLFMYGGGTIVALGTAYLLYGHIGSLGTSMYTAHPIRSSETQAAAVAEIPVTPPPPPLTPIDPVAYDAKMASLSAGDTTGRWPVKAAYPTAGAILPFKRIVAYYGNFYSKNMGVLGEYAPDVMIQKLQSEVKKWQAADPTTDVIPAIHYIAVTAQASAGADGKYRARMPFSQIDRAIDLAHQVHGIAFVDIQPGKSTVQAEVPLLEKYLKMPDVHLGIDPEFYMKGGSKPGTVIGTMDAADINYVTEYLAKLVHDNNLPPKIFVIHRFTKDMVTNYKNIKTHPEVQIVMDMDGWGEQAKKYGTYNGVIYPEPVQFTGFKLFYKNDIKKKGSQMLTPEEVLKLTPKPLYIQYQ